MDSSSGAGAFAAEAAEMAEMAKAEKNSQRGFRKKCGTAYCTAEFKSIRRERQPARA
jgi:hypothetical protein